MLGIIVLVQTKREIPSLSDIKFSVRVAQDVNVPAQTRFLDGHLSENSNLRFVWEEAVTDRIWSEVAPEVGFEPTTNRLTADRSTTELLWIVSPGD